MHEWLDNILRFLSLFKWEMEKQECIMLRCVQSILNAFKTLL